MTTPQQAPGDVLKTEHAMWVFNRDRVTIHQYKMRWTRSWSLGRMATMYGLHNAELG